jgi:hypothetical protein
MTLVDIDEAALRTRSDSTKILDKFGTIEAKIETISSESSLEPARVLRRAPSARIFFSTVLFKLEGSEKDIGRVVKSAANRRRKRS